MWETLFSSFISLFYVLIDTGSGRPLASLFVDFESSAMGTLTFSSPSHLIVVRSFSISLNAYFVKRLFQACTEVL